MKKQKKTKKNQGKCEQTIKNKNMKEKISKKGKL